MTSNVDFDQLAEKLAGRDYAYLITVLEGGQPNPVPVMPVLRGNTVEITAIGGRKSRTNLARSKDVTVLWPPVTPGDYTVIADGVAEVTDPGTPGDDNLASLTFVPSRAVLIRVATPASPGETPCYSDCMDLKLAPQGV
ncbi:MAG TPA: hypothetical protein VFR17_09270 [Mycobacterium sp.]|nr:hypothetical protein [Mycobacterium sp.]